MWCNDGANLPLIVQILDKEEIIVGCVLDLAVVKGVKEITAGSASYYGG